MVSDCTCAGYASGRRVMGFWLAPPMSECLVTRGPLVESVDWDQLTSVCRRERPSASLIARMGSRPPRPPRPPLHVKNEFRIKKEAPDDEIKEYAETAMNEFLGWYGYDKVNSRDTQGLDLHHFASRTSPTEEDSSDDARSCSSPPRKDSLIGPGSPSESDSGTANGTITCCWCSKFTNHKSFTLKTPGGLKFFCSELCFTQCRRANFKRNKTCDWCRHIRHTVNYVDFQDGEHQLQFCSDKCLNQYKMNIFCKETEAHLQLHPHLAEGSTTTGAPGALITPELWLRDCRSASPPSASPSPPSEPPRKEQLPRERKKGARARRTKSPPKLPHTYPPPLLPLNGGLGLLHPNLPPPRPPFLGFFPHAFPGEQPLRGARLHPGMKPHLMSPSPPVMPPPSRPPLPPPPKSLLPPVTILIPYPIPLPIPMPIPFPIPIPMDMTKLPFYKPNKDEKSKESLEEKKETIPVVTPQEVDSSALEPGSSKSLLPPKLSTNLENGATKPSPSKGASSSRESPSSTSILRPLRKRRRQSDLPKDAETGQKRKTVPA